MKLEFLWYSTSLDEYSNFTFSLIGEKDVCYRNHDGIQILKTAKKES